ncbi:MFS transporter [Amycolatopsis sp. FDAARGOS 1241]|uniref:MFS transporter n=1 Tax=Amycolatopsis sp. FDAARGOS 1241 TaxID=2778070 RepID=UPI001950D248|nr:MFS transporter [Amycolatopsis sp. FDAARGOS 1241]QRP42653.1 MFS transporter [Amycolatopsis sp. FDAARGOS 1241]
MTVPARLTFEELLDRPGARPLRRVVLVLCALVTTLDGFDTQSIALAAPAISREWDVPAAAFGTVFGIGLAGSLVGTVLLGRLGDRYGRRRILMLSVALFAVCSLLTPLADSMPVLVVARLLTGIGLGGALPAAITLTAEYAPSARRGSFVGLMFCGFPFGGVLAGVLAAPLVPAFGWASVFVVGGVVPLALFPVMWRAMPESPQHLLDHADRIGLDRVLDRLGTHGVQVAAVPAPARSPIARLFADGRARGTVLLWLTLFLALMLAYLLVNWIPLVSRAAGANAAGASLAVATLNVGAITGCLLLGRIADTRRPTVVVGSGFVLGALAIAAVGVVGTTTGALLAATFVAGFFAIGSQMCLAAVCAGFYETSSRATGVGAAMGAGRIGGIAGPVLGGILLGAGYASSTIFLITAVAAVLAAVTIIPVGASAPRSAVVTAKELMK